MGVISVLLGILLTLAVPVAIIMTVASALARARREDQEPDSAGIGTVRRLFLYGLALVSIGLAASGLALLVGGVLDALFGDLVVAESDTELAVSLSLTVVGVPAWLIFAWLAQRSVQQHPVERRSLLRWTYLSLVRGAAVAGVVGFGVGVGAYLTGVEESFDGSTWGWFLVALAAWAGHHRVARAGLPPTAATRFLDRLYLAFGSVLGLYVLGVGLAFILVEAGMYAYDSAFRDAIIEEVAWHETLRLGLVMLLVGGLAWWWHWIARLRLEPTTALWHIVVFIFGILAGVAYAVIPAAFLLFLVLGWLLDVPDSRDATEYFASAVPAAGFALVGVASWVYHRTLLGEVAPAEEQHQPARLYRYLVAAAGLLALSAGLTWAFALVVDAVTPSTDLLADWWREPLATTLTLVLVGAPLWWRYWSSAQRAVEVAGAAERQSLPRRAFLFAIFGISVLVVLVNLAILLFQLFDAALDGTFGWDTVRDARWSMALLLTAGAVAAYYWLILREDQAAAEAESVVLVRPATALVAQVLLVAPSEAAAVVASALAEHGVRVRRWERADGKDATLTEEGIAALVARLSNLDAPAAVVVVRDGGAVDVIPVTTEA